MMNREPENALRSTILTVYLWYMLGNKQDKRLIVNNCYSNDTRMNTQDLFYKGFFSTSSCCCCLFVDADIPNTGLMT